MEKYFEITCKLGNFSDSFPLPPIKEIKQAVAISLLIFVLCGDDPLIGADRLCGLNVRKF